jgi:4-amino-4-deoxy-L-arabinose transferase-like glycosyltransferase
MTKNREIVSAQHYEDVSLGQLPAAWKYKSVLPHVLILVMISSVALFLHLGRCELMGAREPKAITPARQMVQSGNWVVPYLGNRPRLEKPPLVYWRIAVVGLITGEVGRWEGRLPSAIEGLLLVLLCYAIGRSLLGPSAGLAAACFLIATPAFVYEARQAGPDMPFTLYSTLAVAAAWWSWTTRIRRRRWMFVVLFYVSLSLAALCKGPFIVVNCCLPIFVLACWRRKPLRLVWQLKPWLGVLIVAAMIVPWLMLLWRHGIDPRSLWGREVSQKLHPHIVKSLQYLVGETFPWIPLFLGGLTVPFLKRHHFFPRVVWTPWIWFVSSFLGISLLFTAKANYYTSLAVPISLLVGLCWCGVVRLFREKLAAWQERLVLHSQIAVLGIGGIVSAIILEHKYNRGLFEPAVIAACFVAAAVVMAVLYRRDTAVAKGVAMLCVLSTGVLTAGYIPTISAYRSLGGPGRQLSERIRQLPPDTPVYDYLKQCAYVYYHLENPLPWIPKPGDLAKHLRETDEPFYLAMQWQLAERDYPWRIWIRSDADGTKQQVNVKDWFEVMETYSRPHQSRPAVVLLRYKGAAAVSAQSPKPDHEKQETSATRHPLPPGRT